MKITVYTTTDCQFSKQEREYLAGNKLQYEEKNLETNKDFLTEMLALSNNFAGTPVTRVEKDDGTITVLKGFTKEEFDTVFGFTTTPANTTPEPLKTEEPVKPNETPVTTTPPETPIVPPVETTPTNPTPPTPPVDEKLGSVLDKLEEKTEAPTTPTETVSPTAETPQTTAPSIPDFPADAAPQPVK